MSSLVLLTNRVNISEYEICQDNIANKINQYHSEDKRI